MTTVKAKKYYKALGKAILIAILWFDTKVDAQSNLDSLSVIKLPSKFPISYIDKIIQRENGIVFITLHDNEYTAQQAIRMILKDSAGTALLLRNNKERNLKTQWRGKRIEIDPNRIFDTKLRDTLKSNAFALDSIKNELALTNLNQLKEAKLVVSLHNNTPRGLSIYTYKPEETPWDSTFSIHINPYWEPDDFIITTDSVQFNYFKSLNMNCIYDHGDKLAMDGSLSTYMQKAQRPFLSIECRYGHLQRQMEIIKAIYNYYSNHIALP